MKAMNEQIGAFVKGHSETIKAAAKILLFLLSIIVIVAVLLAGCGDPNVTVPVNVEVVTPDIGPGSTHYRVFTLWYALDGSRLATCQTCHAVHSGTETYLNDYGQDISEAMQAGLAFADSLVAVEGTDSDGDGFTNLEEIGALTLPGDGNDHP